MSISPLCPRRPARPSRRPRVTARAIFGIGRSNTSDNEEAAEHWSPGDDWNPIVAPMGANNAVTRGLTRDTRTEQVVRFGFPKGSLQKSTEELFARAGMRVKVKDRNYFPTSDDEDVAMVLFRSQEIPRYVEDGVIDFGICGRDWVVESGSDVVVVAELRYSKATANPASWVIAVPEDSPVRAPEDLEGTLIASELVETTKRYFADKHIPVKVEYSWGATEVKASLPGVGAVVDITETGSSLRANKLRVVDTILASTTRLIANKQAWADPAKRAKIEDLALLLQGAIDGKRKVGLKMNLPSALIAELTAVLPSAKSPTVSPLTDADFCAVEVVVDEDEAKSLVPLVRRMGATGIVTYPINLSIH